MKAPTSVIHHDFTTNPVLLSSSNSHMDFQCDFPALGPTINPLQGEIKGVSDVILLQTKKKS